MNPVVKEQWLAALRSGEYKQGRGALRQGDDTFCCLGVLCDLAVKNGVIPEPTYIDVGHRYTYVNSSGALPIPVIDWAEVDSPTVSIGLIDSELAEENDRGLTFLQIADLIEAEL